MNFVLFLRRVIWSLCVLCTCLLIIYIISCILVECISVECILVECIDICSMFVFDYKKVVVDSSTNNVNHNKVCCVQGILCIYCVNMCLNDILGLVEKFSSDVSSSSYPQQLSVDDTLQSSVVLSVDSKEKMFLKSMNSMELFKHSMDRNMDVYLESQRRASYIDRKLPIFVFKCRICYVSFSTNHKHSICFKCIPLNLCDRVYFD